MYMHGTSAASTQHEELEYSEAFCPFNVMLQEFVFFLYHFNKKYKPTPFAQLLQFFWIISQMSVHLNEA